KAGVCGEAAGAGAAAARAGGATFDGLPGGRGGGRPVARGGPAGALRALPHGPPPAPARRPRRPGGRRGGRDRLPAGDVGPGVSSSAGVRLGPTPGQKSKRSAMWDQLLRRLPRVRVRAEVLLPDHSSLLVGLLVTEG